MASSTAANEEDGPLVVNVGHLMAYVDEQRAEGNAAYKAGKHSEALAAWQLGLDAIAQCEGKPMTVEGTATVLAARSVLHSNKGQALITMQFWRRAVQELTEALEVDHMNAKALWRRYKAHKALKSWAEAGADLDLLMRPEMQEAAGPLLADAGLTGEKLAATREELRQKQQALEAELEATLEDRMEDAAHKNIEGMRLQFEDVVARNGLRGNEELSAELADMIMRPGGVTVGHIANVYQIDDDDAQIMLDWVKKAVTMRDMLGYNSMDAI